MMRQEVAYSDTSLSVDGADSSEEMDDRPYGMDEIEQKAEEEAAERLTRRETRGVQVWRVTTLLSMLIAAIAVTLSTYRFLDDRNSKEFRATFDIFSAAIEDSLRAHVADVVESAQYVSEDITKTSTANSEEFPLVTVPLFEVGGRQARSRSGLLSIIFAPKVLESERADWEGYAARNYASWIDESAKYHAEWNEYVDVDLYDWSTYVPTIFKFDSEGIYPVAEGTGPWYPFWQSSPPPFLSNAVNSDLTSDHVMVNAAEKYGGFVISRTVNVSLDALLQPEELQAYHDALVDSVEFPRAQDRPHSVLLVPVYATLHNRTKENMAGILVSIVAWDEFMADLLPDAVSGITAVLRNSCNESFTYELSGRRAMYLGPGDKHDQEYDEYGHSITLFTLEASNDATYVNSNNRPCDFSLSVYPSQSFEGEVVSNDPGTTTVILVIAFAFMIAVFCMFDLFVVRRNRKLVEAMSRTNAIVSQMFPSNVRDRLFAETENENLTKKGNANGKNRLKRYLMSGDNELDKADDDDEKFLYKTKPIADLFPETTIMFADLAGFTAWSSMREPTQVFILLETIYKAMDEIANMRRVYKVETVGDCYVAVTGLPDPRKDHAVLMCRFAVDCLHRIHILTKKLEVILGPDTTDLNMRFGLHSGPVTAGVLRGERSRFQLFGDTMNTASRMETNGIPGKIHLSQETADLLLAAGKEHWIVPRDDKIVAKGKGELQTYWLVTTKSSSHAQSESNESDGSQNYESADGVVEADVPDPIPVMDEKTDRLVQWNVEVLLTLLKKVVARRGGIAPAQEAALNSSVGRITTTPLDEVQEIIHLPRFERQNGLEDDDDVDLGESVAEQLREYVSAVASMYRGNPFHNFEHASHVTMSVVKLLSRIVAPDVDAVNSDLESALHDYTYGITSDPLTQFACVFSALIHDVDHSGVPNTQLIKENPQLAKFYKDKSVAEQNSVDLSWDLLQDSTFADLRAAIYPNEAARIRFRQLVVNSVMATDIMDKDLKALRNARWDKAFSGEVTEESHKDAVDRKATIVIEHLIQASDVAHTMQHWHIYRKWNQRLFEELYSAYMDGRAANDPSSNWYKGEIGFFDFYIIPLAKKLKECGVFGVSSDEYLNYAEKNRQEWEQRGQEVVASMIESTHRKFGTK